MVRTGLADAVRAALAEGLQKPAEGVPYIKEKFGLDVTNQQFSSYKSQENARQQEKAVETPSREEARPASATPIAPVAGATGRGPAGLAVSVEAIKTLVDQLGVDQVVAIAKLFAR